MQPQAVPAGACGARRKKKGAAVARPSARPAHLADGLQVPLHEVGVLHFPEAVVVKIVVLHVPGLGEHPVEPLHDPAPQATQGKALGEEILIRVRVVVTPVARVVGDGSPSRERPQRQGHDGDRVRRHPHGLI